MRQIKTRAAVLALMSILAACSGDPAATDPVAAGDRQTTSAAPEPDCPAVAFHHDGLAPGCWAIRIRGVADSPFAELDLPTGFSGNDAWVWTNPASQDEWGAITLLPVGDVYADPCTRSGDPTGVGSSVEDFVTALAAQKVTTTSKAVPVSMDGHEGVYLELSVPAGFDVRSCRGQGLVLWEAASEEPGADAGQVNRYWVVDVDGQRVVLSVATTEDATAETVDLFTGIAETATFAEG
jgi:hypothetical protein